MQGVLVQGGEVVAVYAAGLHLLLQVLLKQLVVSAVHRPTDRPAPSWLQTPTRHCQNRGRGTLQSEGVNQIILFSNFSLVIRLV